MRLTRNLKNKGRTLMIETPSILIDIAKVKSNIKGMSEVAKSNNVHLRPHTKTHKMPKIAEMQIESGAVGIAVAKTTEAKVMAANGIKDIFIAYPVVADAAINRVLELNRTVRLIVGVDSLEGAKRLSEKAKLHDQNVEVRLEVDTGLKRTGVQYDNAIKLATTIANLENIKMTGIYTFKGAVFKGRPTMDLRKAGLEEGELMVSLADEMRDKGLEIKDVSVGSTPTAKYVAQVDGITEIRPGTYVFYDRMQAKYDVCDLDNCAAKVIATIVSMPSEDLLIIDGGSKTFATDVQPDTEPLKMKGFGDIIDFPDANLERMTEEHGMIRVKPGHNLKIGDTVKIIPNHICSTVNLHNSVYVVHEEGSIEELSVLARGKLQ